MDQELSAKINSELDMEKDAGNPNELPETIRDYLENSPFKVGLVLLSPPTSVNIA